MSINLIVRSVDKNVVIQIFIDNITDDMTVQVIYDQVLKELNKLDKNLQHNEKLLIIVAGKIQDLETKLTREYILYLNNLTVLHYYIKKI